MFMFGTFTYCEDPDEMRHYAAFHQCLHCKDKNIFSRDATLNGALQEYERHFSGVWGHFQECRIFHNKSTKCTHTSLL